ncbi:hypothetical protein HN51_000370, partial [Arachis hypogaea]
MTTHYWLSLDLISLVDILPVSAFVGNAIVDMYAKCGKMDQANRFFERMELKDVVSWNIMVMGYSQTRIFRN